MAPVPPKHKKRIHSVSMRDRLLVGVCKCVGAAFGYSSLVQQAKAHSRRAGERLSEKRADAGLSNEIHNLMACELLGMNPDTKEIIVPPRTRELLQDVIGDGSDDESREAYIALSARIREVCPPTKPKTKAECIKDLASLRWRYETAQQENEAHKAAQDAHIADLRRVVKTLLSRPAPRSLSATTAVRVHQVLGAPPAPAPPVGASPLRRAHTTPAVFKFEDFEVPLTPAGARAPLLLQGLAPMTPVSNPRPPRLMDAIREEPESPTRARQRAAQGAFRVDQDGEDDAMDEDEDEDMRPSTSFIEKGKDALRRFAGAVTAPMHMHLLGGQAPPTPDMTPVFARMSKGAAERAWSPSPLDMEFAEETAEDARDAQIRALRDEVAQLKERLRAAQRAATDKDAAITELQGRLAEKEAALAGLVKGFMPMLPALAEAAKHVPDAAGLVVQL